MLRHIINKDFFFFFFYGILTRMSFLKKEKKKKDVISYAQNFFHSGRVLTNKDVINSLHLSQNIQELLILGI